MTHQQIDTPSASDLVGEPVFIQIKCGSNFTLAPTDSNYCPECGDPL